MILALTCTLCLAGAAQPAAGVGSEDGATTLSLASAPAPSDLRLSGAGAALDLAQPGLQEDGGEGDQGHGGHGAWMGTTMIVVMVVMMVGVGAVMMARGSFRMAPSSGAAAVALPVLAPAGFSTPGG